MPDAYPGLEGYVSYKSARKRFEPSIRNRMCVRARSWCISGEPFETVTALSDELMGEWERKKGKWKEGISFSAFVCVWDRVSRREKENSCYTFWHRPDPIVTPTQGMLAVLFFLVLWRGEKSPLTGNLAAQTHHLNSVTHLLRSAVTCLQTRQALSV